MEENKTHYKPLTLLAFEVYVYGPLRQGKSVNFLDPKGDKNEEIQDSRDKKED
jgi:hypothetical protein